MLGATLCCFIIFYASNTQDDQMALQFKGDSYRSRAISQSKRNTGGVVEKTMANLMEGIMAIDDSVTKEANSLSLSFLRDIESNKKLQAEADAEWATIQAHLKEFKKDENWDDSYEGWATNQFLNRGVTDAVRKDVFKNIREGNLEIITPTVSPMEKEITSKVSPEEKFHGLMTHMEHKESSGNSKARVLIKKGSQKGTYAMGLFGFTNDRLEDWANVHDIPYDNADEKSVFNSKFLNNPELQRRVMVWHLKDIEKRIRKVGFDKLVKQGATLQDGTRITMNGMIAAAHIGGFSGMTKFVRSRGTNNPTDQFGTSLKDYAEDFSSSTKEATEVADNTLNSLQKFFNSGERGKTKAIKVAMNQLGMTEEEAKKYLSGMISKHGTNITSDNVRLKSFVAELPKTLEGLIIEKSRLEGLTDPTTSETARLGTIGNSIDALVAQKDNDLNRIALKDPNKVFNLNQDQLGTLLSANGVITKEQAIKQGYGLAFDYLTELKEDAKTLGQMPEFKGVDNLTDYQGYVAEVRKAFDNVEVAQLPKEVQETLKLFETTLKEDLSTFVPKTLEDRILKSMMDKNDGEPLTLDQIKTARTEIKKAEMKAKNDGPIADKNMATAIIVKGQGDDNPRYDEAKRFLEIEANSKNAGTSVAMRLKKINPDTGNAEFVDGMQVTGVDGKITYQVDGTTVEGYTALSKEAVDRVSKIDNELSIPKQQYNSLLIDTFNLSANLMDVSKLVNDNPEALTSTGSLAAWTKATALELDTLTGLIKSYIDDQGENAIVSQDEVESYLRTQNVLGENDTFQSMLNDKTKNAASARKQFLAASVLLIFRTGKAEGQTGQSMSNKDYERFSRFLTGFKDTGNFNASVNRFMLDKFATLESQRSVLMNDSRLSTFKKFYGFNAYDEDNPLAISPAKFITDTATSNPRNGESYNYFKNFNTEIRQDPLPVVPDNIPSIGDPLLNDGVPNNNSGLVDPSEIQIDFRNLPDGVSPQDAWDSLEPDMKFIAEDGKVGTK